MHHLHGQLFPEFKDMYKSKGLGAGFVKRRMVFTL